MRRFIALTLAVFAFAPASAEAFCGFYVDTGGAQMFNNATQVVLMREGTRTVLSMQNNYEGPLNDFALVVPVPTVLRKDDVRTLPRALFEKINAMGSPRLVEYWEHDPCDRPEASSIDVRNFARHSAEDTEKFGVTIEAKFDVDEYQIVILSAKDSTGLDRYLRSAHYKIPDGAVPLLRPYVEGGSKFFVAKVDPKKVKLVNGQAQLSPLRFFYDSEEFSLPIRLGLANSSGTQDLIISILAPDQRYDVANYPNAFIPTNIDVKDEVRTRFGEFYAALFDRTLQQHPGAVITEYSWQGRGCDPCPGPFRLADEDYMLLGEAVLLPRPEPPPPPSAPPPGPDEITIDMGDDDSSWIPPREYVLTRLHARYSKGDAPNDLVFRAASPVSGGNERGRAPLPRSAIAAETNRFQGRYVIRHPWTGPIECKQPYRGGWGGDPNGGGGGGQRKRAIGAALDTAFAPRGVIQLQDLVAHDIPEISIQQGVPLVPPLPKPAERRVKPQGCGCRSSDAPTPLVLGALLLGLGVVRSRRRRPVTGASNAGS